MTRCMRPVRRLKKASYRAAAVALLRASEQLKRIKTANDDQKTGRRRSSARRCPFRPARSRSMPAKNGSVIVGKILEKDQYSYGFDSQTGEYVNLISKGIIDPTKVVRVAIQKRGIGCRASGSPPKPWWPEVPKKNAGGGGGMPPGGGGMGGMDF